MPQRTNRSTTPGSGAGGVITDFDQVTNYTKYIEDDPFRRVLHFPAVEEVLGNVNKKRILDIGCGDGLFSRLLAERGATVVGYDRARQQIAQARARVGAPGLDATFVVATPQTFFHDGTFDAAMSVMVLNYATSPEELAAFFRSESRYPWAGRTVHLRRLQSVVLGIRRGLRRPTVYQAGEQQHTNRLPGSRLWSCRDDAGGKPPVHERRVRAGRDQRRNEAGSMEETLCHAGCRPTDGRLFLAAVPRTPALRTLYHA